MFHFKIMVFWFVIQFCWAFTNFHVKDVCTLTSECTHTRFEISTHHNQIRFMLYHERERTIKKNAKFVHIVYLLAELISNIFDQAFLLMSV